LGRKHNRQLKENVFVKHYGKGKLAGETKLHTHTKRKHCPSDESNS
jgi:hypothetical protein